jgi:hypothetical protein
VCAGVRPPQTGHSECAPHLFVCQPASTDQENQQ